MANEQLSAVLHGLEEKIDRLYDDVDALLAQAIALRQMRSAAFEAVSKDQPFSSVVKSLSDVSTAVATCSAAHAKATDSLVTVKDHAQRVREVANG